MSRIREYLRTLTTANGSEVVLPWFPEADGKKREMRMIRRTRNEPEGPVYITYPLGLFLWTGLSLVWSLKMCSRNGKVIRERQKISRLKQFLQMLYLAWWKNKSPLNYYDSKFFLPEFRKEAEHYTSIQQLGRLLRQINKKEHTERLDHKLQAYASLTAAKIPTVEIVEVFDANGGRAFGKSDEELQEYLGQDFFVKPVNLYGGLYTTRWLYNRDHNSYSNGEREVPAGELWKAITEEAQELWCDKSEKGARVVQPLIRNHAELKPLSKEALNTIRLEAMRFPDGRVEFFYASLRMGYGDRINDTSHSVGAQINLETGKMYIASSRLLLDQKLAKHPTTGAQIEGRVIPCWREVRELVKRASDAFPENPVVGWDIAVTPDGPRIIEANCNPNFNGVQFKLQQPITRSLFAELYWSWLEPDTLT